MKHTTAGMTPALRRRRTLAAVLSLLLLIALSLLLIGCGGGGPGGTTEPGTTEPEAKVALNNIGDYEVVYYTGISVAEYQEIDALLDRIEAECGVRPDDSEDFVIPGRPIPTDTKEILIGMTNRQESGDRPLQKDWVIRYEQNGRVVINAGSAEALKTALQTFTATYIPTGEGKVYVPTTPHSYHADYRYDSLTLGGTPIADYCLVHDRESGALALYLQEKIAELCGVVIPIEKLSSTVAEHEICIGQFDEAARKPSVVGTGYRAEMKGGNLILSGNGDDAAYSALLAFSDQYLKNAGTGATLAIPLDTPLTGDNETTTFVNLNLLPNLPALELIPDSEGGIFARFLQTRAELPNEVTVLERVYPESYPLSQMQEYYVAVDGDNSAVGDKEHPLATVTEALKRVRAAGMGGVINLRGGVYSLSQTLAINSVGTSSATPIFIRAYNGEEVVFTTERRFDTDSFRELDPDDEVAARLPEAAREHVLYTNVFTDLKWTPADIAKMVAKGTGGNGSTPTLALGDFPYTLARFPNETPDLKQLAYFTVVYETGQVTTRDGSDLYFDWIARVEAGEFGEDENGNKINPALGWKVQVQGPALEALSWINTGNIWYHGSTFEGWEHGHYNISIDCYHDDGLLGSLQNDGYYSLDSVQPNSWGTKHSTNSPAGRNTYYLYNAIEALDVPGEWFLDEGTGNLYIYPTAGFETEQLRYSGTVSGDAIALSNVKNVVIDGITVDGSNGYGILVKNSENVLLQNLTVRNTGRTGVYLLNVNDTAVIFSDFSRSRGDHMLCINNGTGAQQLIPCNTVVQNNTFHDPMPTKQTGLYFSACRAVMSHNYLVDANISGAGFENIIEYNEVAGGSKDVTDAGLIYIGGQNNRGNHIRYNLLHKFNKAGNGVYNDTFGGGSYTYCNVISTVDGGRSGSCNGFYSSNGYGSVCYNNLFLLKTVEDSQRLNGTNVTDRLQESTLFFKYYGDNDPRNDLAGHWWRGMTESSVKYYTKYADAFEERFPGYMEHVGELSMLFGQIEAEGEDYVRGELEDRMRSPSYCTIVNNVILGGTGFQASTNPMECGGGSGSVIYNDYASKVGIHCTSTYAHNYFNVDRYAVVENPDEYDYSIRESMLAEINAAISSDYGTTFESIPLDKIGLTE